MALLTKTRPESCLSTWESIFPNPTLGTQQSTVFVKKLLAIAVSNITYLRAIFPEGAFGDKKLDSMSLKVLKEDGRCPGAFQLIQWVKGCFDALDRRYLQAVVLGIYLDPADCHTAVETYTFRFSYTQAPGVDVYRNERKISGRGSQCGDVRAATGQLLRSLLVLTQNLAPLPEEAYLAMRLLYRDSAAGDYSPAGFVASAAADFRFREEAFLISAGSVETPFHELQLRVKALSSNFSASQVEPADSPPSQLPAPLLCPCGMEEETGLMLVCVVCASRQHAVCIGILDTGVRIKHVCGKCADTTRPCTDPQLSGVSPGASRSLCLWRRCLSSCSAMSTITQHTLTRRMQVSPAEAGQLLQRLRAEQFVSPLGQGRNPVRFSPTPLLRTTGLVKYFLSASQLGERRALREISADTNKLNKRKLSSDYGMDTDPSDVKKRKECIYPISPARL